MGGCISTVRRGSGGTAEYIFDVEAGLLKDSIVYGDGLKMKMGSATDTILIRPAVTVSGAEE